jgi:hypothetical protein
MRSFTRLAVAVALVAAATPSLGAQAHPLAGRWEVDYERGKRIENGEVTVIRGAATLTLELRGDSLVGTLVRPATPEQPAPDSLRFAGKATAGGAVFAVKTVAMNNDNGEITSREAVMTWTLSATGDALEGTLLFSVTGMDFPAEPTPVKGTRVK